MAAEALTSADLSWAGVAGDRRWAFIRPASGENGFPWHTIRENPAMSAYVPRLLDPQRPDKSAVQVQAPSGKTYELTDPDLISEMGDGVRVMRLDRGTFDALPVSLITTATVSALCALAGVPGNELRFRPNFVIAPASGTPYAEDEWVGGLLHIGDACVRVDRRDTRCVIVNVDPGRGQPDAPMLKIIGRDRRACAGVYGSTVRPGLVKLGDPVRLAPRGLVRDDRVYLELHQPLRVHEAGHLDEGAGRPHRSETLRVRAGGLAPLLDVGEHYPGPDHIGQRCARLLECLLGDIEAADRLRVDVTGGCGAAVLGDRRGPGDADVGSAAHGAGEADFWLKRRT
jgi:uncharacterized protein YcbX